MSERERWAYEELQVGDVIQPGDEWQNDNGRWHSLVFMAGACIQVRDNLRARRPYKISTIQEIGDALANAQKATTQLQDERDEAHKERDLARSEVARLSTELWARKPLEDRVASLTEELAQAREASQQLLQTITDNADQFAWANKTLEQERDEARAEVTQLRAERQEFSARLEAEITAAALVIDELTAAKDALKSAQRARDELQLQVDELRADRERLQGLIDNLLDEPTANRVYKMLEDMLDQTEWVGQCLDSTTYEQMSCIQRTISVIAERVRDMGKEATRAND